MSSGKTTTQSIMSTVDDLVGIYSQLYDDWSRAATQLMDVFEQGARQAGTTLPALPALPTLPKLPASKCSCEIPPPCWMPRELGERRSQLCPGQTATICLRIVNCGMSARTLTVTTGTDATGVSITNSPLKLGPMEEGTVVVSYKADSGTEHSEPHRILLWVNGCNQHLLRWTVTAGHRSGGACHHVDVEDCPDNVHHWYDHFYCAHTCGCQDG